MSFCVNKLGQSSLFEVKGPVNAKTVCWHGDDLNELMSFLNCLSYLSVRVVQVLCELHFGSFLLKSHMLSNNPEIPFNYMFIRYSDFNPNKCFLCE